MRAGGLDVTGYHVVNVAIHLACALLLFGLIRHTLKGDGSIAAAVALLWTVHPLNSEVVDYVTQRTESLMALCYLLTLYGSIRAIRSKRPQRWHVAGGSRVRRRNGLQGNHRDRAADGRALRPGVRLFDSVPCRPSAPGRGSTARSRRAGCCLRLSSSRAARRSRPASARRALSPWTYLLNQTRDADAIPVAQRLARSAGAVLRMAEGGDPRRRLACTPCSSSYCSR